MKAQTTWRLAELLIHGGYPIANCSPELKVCPERIKHDQHIFDLKKKMVIITSCSWLQVQKPLASKNIIILIWPATNLFWVVLPACIALESEGLPHFCDDLREVGGIGSELGGLQLMVCDVGASSNTLHEWEKMWS